jgi:hypothetical protein
MRHTIEVTQTDIDKADPKNSGRCVVATAIARSIPSATRIEVDVQTVRFTVAGERFVYVTPYTVSGYVVAFDAGDDLYPFKFRLDEDRAVAVRQTRKTDAGKVTNRARDNARAKAARAKAAQERLDALTGGDTLPPPTPTAVRAAKASAAAAHEEAAAAAEGRDAVVAAYAGQRKTTHDLSLPQAPARVYKKKVRHYGHRELRVNQDRG